MKKLFELTINNLKNGFSASVKISEIVDERNNQTVEKVATVNGRLEKNSGLLTTTHDFWEKYALVSQSFQTYLERQAIPNVLTKESIEETFKKCQNSAQQLNEEFCDWMRNPEFAEIAKIIQEEGLNSEENRILLTTDDPSLLKLPWRKWDVIANLPNTLVSIGSNEFQRVDWEPKDRSRILILLGHEAKKLHANPFEKLEKDYGDRIEFVWKSPENLNELKEILAESCDILLFIGHGRSSDNWQTGEITITSDLKVSIADLREPFQTAIAKGLRLVILNCCDGLGLAYQLGAGQKLHLPHTIVMQDLFPVLATPIFLEFFLSEFTQYQSLDISLVNTQKRLEEHETDFPCISLLPYLCRNSSSKPITWIDLSGLPECPYGDLGKSRLSLVDVSFENVKTAISSPAKKFGIYIENGLFDLVCKDIGISNNQNQNLSLNHIGLLELVFQQIWMVARSNKETELTIKGYQSIGLPKILSDYAETVFDRLNLQDKEKRFKRIFTQLVDPQSSEREDSSRFATYEEIGEESENELIIELKNARLIVFAHQETGIEVIHKALIYGWQRLVEWIKESDERPFLVRQKQLRNEVSKWKTNQRKKRYLLQGSSLDDVKGWLVRPEITSEQRKFIELSLKQSDRRLKLTIFGVTSALVVALGLAGATAWAWQRSEYQKLITEANNLSNLALSQFQSGDSENESLINALNSAQKLKELVKNNTALVDYPTTNPLLALQTITNNIREKNELKFNVDYANKVFFSANGNQILVHSIKDRKIIVSNLFGRKLAEWQTDTEIQDMDISGDGKYISGVGGEGQLYIWDLKGKVILKKVPTRYDSNYSQDSTYNIVKFSKDSHYIALASSFYSEIKFLDVAGKKILKFENKSKGDITCIEFTPSGKEILIGNAVGQIAVWELKTLRKTREFQVNEKQVFRIRVSPDGKSIATMGVDTGNNKNNYILVSKLWNSFGEKIADLGDNTSLKRLTIDNGEIHFNPNGRQLAVAALGDNAIKFYDSKSGKLVNQIAIPVLSGSSFSYHPSGNQIAISSINNIKLLDLSHNSFIQSPNRYEQDNGNPSVGELQFTATGESIIVTDFTNKNYDEWNWRQQSIKRNNMNDNVVTLSPDGKSIILVLTDGFIEKYSLDGKLVTKLKDEEFSTSIKENSNYSLQGLVQIIRWQKYRFPFSYASSLGGNRIITIGYNWLKYSELTPVRLWDLSNQTLKILQSDRVISDSVNAVAISPDGKYAMTISYGLASIWDGASGKLLPDFDVNRKILDDNDASEVSGVALILSGAKIVGVFENSNAAKAGVRGGDQILEIDGKKVSDVEDIFGLLNGKQGTAATLKLITKNQKVEQKVINREIYSLSSKLINSVNKGKFSPNSRYLITWNEFSGQNLYVRNIYDNTLLRLDTLGKIISVHLSPDSKLVAVACSDYTIRIWDFYGNLITQIKLRQPPATLAFSPDSQQIASLGHPNELSIFSVSGSLIAKYSTPKDSQTLIEDALNRVAFSPDSKYIVTGGRKLTIWHNQNLDELIASGCGWLQDYFAVNPKEKLKVCH